MRLPRTQILIVIASVLILAALVGFILAVNPVPPTELTMSTSAEGTPDHRLAVRYQALLEEEGFTLNILTGASAVETAERLVNGEADVGIISSGIITEEQAMSLSSLGSLFFDPIWIFYQADQDVSSVPDLRGKQVAIGPVGSGTSLTAMRLLTGNGVTEENSTLVTSENFPSLLEKVRAGEVDASIWVAPPDSIVVNEFLRDESLALLSIERIQAYRAQFPYLSALPIGKGSIDLAENIPSEDHVVLAGAANMIVRNELHPNLVRLLSQVIDEVHSPVGIFEDAEQFPSSDFVEITLHEEAQRYLREGETFFESSFPFVLASILDRFIIVLIPLIPLLYPLIRGLPPVYNIAIRRRVTRWYSTLHEIDQKKNTLQANEIDAELAKLDELMQTLLAQPAPPLVWMGEFYNLQLHINLVAERIEERRTELANAS